MLSFKNPIELHFIELNKDYGVNDFVEQGENKYGNTLDLILSCADNLPYCVFYSFNDHKAFCFRIMLSSKIFIENIFECNCTKSSFNIQKFRNNKTVFFIREYELASCLSVFHYLV